MLMQKKEGTRAKTKPKESGEGKETTRYHTTKRGNCLGWGARGWNEGGFWVLNLGE